MNRIDSSSRGFATKARLSTLVLAVAATLIAAARAGAYSGDPDGDLAPSALESIYGTDAFDSGSKPESLFFAVYGVPVCTDGIDNDGDTLIDAADNGCNNTDGDGTPSAAPFWPADDYLEGYFGLAANSPGQTPEAWFIDFIVSGPPVYVPLAGRTCTDGIDNDLDGFSDSLDYPYCNALADNVDLDGAPDSSDTEGPYPNHNGVQATDDCYDEEDNDGDGFTDLADSGCVFGGDIDVDGTADTFDSEGPQPNANGLAGNDDCFDGVDNDLNGMTDLAEPECNECVGLPYTLLGSPGNDILSGTSGPDVILGLGGDDRIRGLAGNDVICAGPGDDKVSGAAGTDTIHGGEGNDRLTGGADNDTLYGGRGTDKLIGGPDDDVIIDDEFTPPYFDDLLSGGPGNDLMGGVGGTNTMRAGGGDDNLQVLEGVNLMLGGGGNDTFQSFGNSTNTMRGGSGDDGMSGGPGQDDMNGGGGTDSCNGGAGASDIAAANCETITNVP